MIDFRTHPALVDRVSLVAPFRATAAPTLVLSPDLVEIFNVPPQGAEDGIG